MPSASLSTGVPQAKIFLVLTREMFRIAEVSILSEGRFFLHALEIKAHANLAGGQMIF
jgi:hypothetical protein